MKRVLGIAASLAIAACGFGFMSGLANASNESATIFLRIDPLQGGLFKEAYRPVNWQVGNTISTTDSEVQPTIESNLTLHGGAITFNPDPDMPVCPDSAINPTTVSVPVETAIAACPEAIIGNGTATFALAQQVSLPRDGVILIFNGGLAKSGPLRGRPRIMIYSYSYDVEVGVYSEATLTTDGQLDFDVPVLTADSSVTSLNLNIPGKPTSVDFPAKGITADLPAGQDPKYARARCATGLWNYGAEFVLGDRPEGLPPGPTTTLAKTGSQPCTGATGKAKFAGLKIMGPGSVKKGKKTTYRVTLKNTGTATARGVKLKVTGKGVSGKATGGNIAPGKSKTVKVMVKFNKKGKIKATVKATAAGTRTKAAGRAAEVK